MSEETCRRVEEVLNEGGQQVTKKERLPNDTGWQLTIANGAKVNIYDTGTINVQGKELAKSAVETILSHNGLPSASPSNNISRSTSSGAREVFVVYGHDVAAKTELEAMLRRWKLEPLILDQLPSEGQTIIEKLERYRERARFAVVLATPDDEGHRAGHPDEKVFRARQNVVLELGMLLAYLGRKRVAILLKDQTKMEKPSDIQGLIYFPFKDKVDEVKLTLAKEIDQQGLKIDLDKV